MIPNPPLEIGRHLRKFRVLLLLSVSCSILCVFKSVSGDLVDKMRQSVKITLPPSFVSIQGISSTFPPPTFQKGLRMQHDPRSPRRDSQDPCLRQTKYTIPQRIPEGIGGSDCNRVSRRSQVSRSFPEFGCRPGSGTEG